LITEGSDQRSASKKEGEPICRPSNQIGQNPSNMNIRSISSCFIAAALSVSASAAVQNPKPISQAVPAYSLELRASQVEGEVQVGFTITASGDVVDPVVVSSTDRLLNNSTLAAVRKWKFTPAMKDGVAISVRVVQPVAFVIPELHSDFSDKLVVSKTAPAAQAKNSANGS
jgi:TonB family protein